MQVNPELVARLENAGLSFTGKDETGQRMEVWTVSYDFFNCYMHILCLFALLCYRLLSYLTTLISSGLNFILNLNQDQENLLLCS